MLYDDPFYHYYPHRHYTQQQLVELTVKLFHNWRDTHFREIPKEVLEFIHETYIDINSNIKGRVGIALWDCYVIGSILWRNCKAYRNGNQFAYIETGTSQGGGAIFARRILDYAERPKQTVITIDPMTGFYGGKDTLVGDIGASEELFWENVDVCNARTNMKLIVGSSYDPESVKQTEWYNIYAALIDGDHSYEGTKGDWCSYGHRILKGGYVFFHDYRMKPASSFGNDPNAMYGVNTLVNEILPNIIFNGWKSYAEAVPANVFVLRRVR